MAEVRQSTARNRTFFMTDSTDHITPKTGLTVTVTLSKDGAAFAAAAGSISEISDGWYNVALTTADTNTLNDLDYHCTSTGADDTDFQDQVIEKSLVIKGTVDTVVNTHTPTTTEFQAEDITEATTDHYKGRVVIFTSGILTDQATRITGYTLVGGIGQFTVQALTDAPVNNMTFKVV